MPLPGLRAAAGTLCRARACCCTDALELAAARGVADVLLVAPIRHDPIGDHEHALHTMHVPLHVPCTPCMHHAQHVGLGLGWWLGLRLGLGWGWG